ncbi:MAG: nitroreductase family protein [Candidatus Omnitrophota bacterium]|nr:MAG: nitroreductase family protein [Candidatus Omnitrophota bacterium]
MQTLQALKSRRSVRTYDKKPVEQHLIEELIDCARFAPTARNEQPWQFVVVTKRDTIQELAQLADHGRFIKDSPCVIAVFCADTKYYLEDGSAATQNILLAAEDLGLVACWVAGDKKPYCEEVKKLLGVPANYKLVSLIPVGYPVTKTQVAVKKKPVKDLLHLEHW